MIQFYTAAKVENYRYQGYNDRMNASEELHNKNATYTKFGKKLSGFSCRDTEGRAEIRSFFSTELDGASYRVLVRAINVHSDGRTTNFRYAYAFSEGEKIDESLTPFFPFPQFDELDSWFAKGEEIGRFEELLKMAEDAKKREMSAPNLSSVEADVQVAFGAAKGLREDIESANPIYKGIKMKFAHGEFPTSGLGALLELNKHSKDGTVGYIEFVNATVDETIAGDNIFIISASRESDLNRNEKSFFVSMDDGVVYKSAQGFEGMNDYEVPNLMFPGRQMSVEGEKEESVRDDDGKGESNSVMLIKCYVYGRKPGQGPYSGYQSLYMSKGLDDRYEVKMSQGEFDRIRHDLPNAGYGRQIFFTPYEKNADYVRVTEKTENHDKSVRRTERMFVSVILPKEVLRERPEIINDKRLFLVDNNTEIHQQICNQEPYVDEGLEIEFDRPHQGLDEAIEQSKIGRERFLEIFRDIGIDLEAKKEESRRNLAAKLLDESNTWMGNDSIRDSISSVSTWGENWAYALDTALIFADRAERGEFTTRDAKVDFYEENTLAVVLLLKNRKPEVFWMAQEKKLYLILNELAGEEKAIFQKMVDELHDVFIKEWNQTVEIYKKYGIKMVDIKIGDDVSDKRGWVTSNNLSLSEGKYVYEIIREGIEIDGEIISFHTAPRVNVCGLSGERGLMEYLKCVEEQRPDEFEEMKDRIADSVMEEYLRLKNLGAKKEQKNMGVSTAAALREMAGEKKNNSGEVVKNGRADELTAEDLAAINYLLNL